MFGHFNLTLCRNPLSFSFFRRSNPLELLVVEPLHLQLILEVLVIELLHSQLVLEVLVIELLHSQICLFTFERRSLQCLSVVTSFSFEINSGGSVCCLGLLELVHQLGNPHFRSNFIGETCCIRKFNDCRCFLFGTVVRTKSFPIKILVEVIQDRIVSANRGDIVGRHGGLERVSNPFRASGGCNWHGSCFWVRRSARNSFPVHESKPRQGTLPPTFVTHRTRRFELAAFAVVIRRDFHVLDAADLAGQHLTVFASTLQDGDLCRC